MAPRAEIVTVALLFVLRAGAPARFPVSKLFARAGAALPFCMEYINFNLKYIPFYNFTLGLVYQFYIF